MSHSGMRRKAQKAKSSQPVVRGNQAEIMHPYRVSEVCLSIQRRQGDTEKGRQAAKNSEEKYSSGHATHAGTKVPATISRYTGFSTSIPSGGIRNEMLCGWPWVAIGSL